MRARVSPVVPLVLIALVALAGCGDETAPTGQPTSNGPTCSYPDSGQSAAKEASPPPATAEAIGAVSVTIATSQGDLTTVLDGAGAPCTVRSFLSLAEQGYFDDTPCHRLTTSSISVLQCGDPSGTGTGGPGYTVPDELTGRETYPAGSLAMARTPQPDSGGSQFFVVYGATPLPPDYTVFGRIDAAGVAVVQTVAAAGTDEAFAPGDGHPNLAVTIESVTVG